MESSGAIRAALRQFQEGAADPTPQGAQLPGRAEAAPGQAGEDNPSAPTLQRSHPSRMGEPLAGRLRNVSRQGFGLVHDERLERGLVLLEIDFGARRAASS